jgi:hypothetical protein
LQGAVNRFDHFRVKNDVGMRRANFIVEKLSNHRRMTKDTARHGQWDSLVPIGKKPQQDDAGKSR